MAEAGIELWLGDTQVACDRESLHAGIPTVLDELDVSWGRQGMWDQPDEGSCSFSIMDNRRALDPVDLAQIAYKGQPFRIYATAPNPDPVAEDVIDKTFGSSTGTLDEGGDYRLESQAQSSTIRTNLATDPNATSTSGKTAGGSAVLATSTAWFQFGTGSISITPNGSNNASSVFPHGASGMTVFQAGKTYTISVYVRLTTAQTGTLNADARKITVRGGAVSAVKFAESAQAPNAAGVTRLSVTFTVPANYTLCTFQIVNGSANAAQVLWYDGLLIEEAGSVGVYFDGSTTTSGYVNAWTGTANASSSTQKYAATSGSAAAVYFAAGPPHDSVVQLANQLTRARYWFASRRYGNEWFRYVRPILPGETWSYSVDVIVSTGARVDLMAQVLRSSDPDDPYLYNLTFDTGGTSRQIIGTNAWVTYTGTITLDPAAPTGGFVAFGFGTYPDGSPFVDNIVVTAPALDDLRLMVMRGRVSDLAFSTSNGQVVEVEVTGIGDLSEPANYSVGDEPWPIEGYVERFDRIASYIPFDMGVTVSHDAMPLQTLAPRDVDAQSILDLLRDLASQFGGAAWPLYSDAVPAHLWIEDPENRDTTTYPLLNTVIKIDACDIPRDQFEIGQGADHLVTLLEMGWKEQDPDDPTQYLDRIVQIVDEDAVALYGYSRLQVSSEIASEAGAIIVGTPIFDRARASDYSVTGITIQSDQLDGVDGQASLVRLLDGRLRPASLVEISNLTEWIPDAVALGWLEGGTILYSDGRWTIDLFLSAAVQSS